MLLNFFHNLLGTEILSTGWGQHRALSAPHSLDSHQALSLKAPFTQEEIWATLFGMQVDSVLGPDGFGPKFVQTIWTLIRDDIAKFFEDFHRGEVYLRGINRAFMVLILKTETTSHPKAYCPISLQNTLSKLITKCLTNKLQPLLPGLIHSDQTGFLKG